MKRIIETMDIDGFEVEFEYEQACEGTRDTAPMGAMVYVSNVFYKGENITMYLSSEALNALWDNDVLEMDLTEAEHAILEKNWTLEDFEGYILENY